MIQIENTLISEEIITENFVCNLNKCKGECCVAGDAGAPLEAAELKIMETVFEKVKPYLNEKGLQAIAEQGLYVIDDDGVLEAREAARGGDGDAWLPSRRDDGAPVGEQVKGG